MDYSRLHATVAVPVLNTKCVLLVGVGGAVRLAGNLIRCGLGKIKMIDPQIVEPVNLARQAFDFTDVGSPKVQAAERAVRRINDHIQVDAQQSDFLVLSDDQIRTQFAGVDLIVAATDNFRCQARCNQAALMLGCPVTFAGLYPNGGGEVLFWHAGLDACHRCLCASRYPAHELAQQQGRSLDPASDGTTIFDLDFMDSLVGMLSIGLLTRGTLTGYGRLIDQLGDRNFLQFSLDPQFKINGRDIIREQLRVPADCDTLFAWNVIARRDPDRGQLPCPDCERYRGVTFRRNDAGQFVRLKKER